jgi:RNA polymerase sigma-70 factor (ECF subfamily)
VSTPAVIPDSAADAESANQRIRALLRAHYREVWRLLRYLGVPPATAEDATQLVFLTATSKLARIERGKERAFLLATAVRIASNQRRSAAYRYERADEDMDARADDAPGPYELLEKKRLRAVLHDVLNSLTDDLRTALVLYELEGFEVAEIAEIVGVPRGTAASRLRRAREAFEREAELVRARHAEMEER